MYCAMKSASLVLLFSGPAASAAIGDRAEGIAQRNADNPHAVFSIDAWSSLQHGGGYYAPSVDELSAKAKLAPISFTEDELQAVRKGSVSIDWRERGAVGPVQQQHPYGTCWAFSMIAVTEAVNVIQGKNPFQKLSEQMVVSCVPEVADGDNSDVLWSWVNKKTGGKYQTEEAYPYNRTCNFYREKQLSPDGTVDGYPGTCNLPGHAPFAPCPPCPGVSRKDGAPPCSIDKSKGFSKASVQGWAFIGPHGVDAKGQVSTESPHDVTRMVAALLKYGPAQIGIDASCVEGYASGIITNCTSRNVDHAVAIVGADTDPVSGVDYWLVRNSWNHTFGAHLETRRPFLVGFGRVPQRNSVVRERRGRGLTPLMYAAMSGCPRAVEVLLEHGACINTEDDDGMTPLHFAAKSADFDVCKILICNGADGTHMDDDDRSPFDLLPLDALQSKADIDTWSSLFISKEL